MSAKQERAIMLGSNETLTLSMARTFVKIAKIGRPVDPVTFNGTETYHLLYLVHYGYIAMRDDFGVLQVEMTDEGREAYERTKIPRWLLATRPRPAGVEGTEGASLGGPNPSKIRPRGK